MVGELTLGQLADLQAGVDAAWPDPMDGLRETIGDMDEDARRAALREAHALAEEGPPAWSAPTTDAGLMHFLRVVLGSDEAAGYVFARITPGEYAALLRVCRGVTPLDEVEALLGLDRSGDGVPITWAQALCELMEAYPGLSVAAIEGLTISTVKAMRAGGKPEVRGVAIKPGMSVKDMVRDARKRFYGPEKGAG
jgi:hypothetical protein